tara:strand:- start:11186 stop:12877 length:1692 start_codon:yes stop_codon:yes gene_type:complete
MTSDRFEELESLLLDWEEGVLDEAGIERLREILRTDTESRAHYVRLQMMTAAMSLDSDAGMNDFAADDEVRGWGENVPHKIRVSTAGGVSRTGRWMLVAATLLIGVLAGRLVQLELADRADKPDEINRPGISIAAVDKRDESEEATSEGVALITRLVDVTWKAGQPSLEVGDALPTGLFEIASGYAQVEFFCGATVILEGPAEIDLKSPVLARVRRGTLRAQVPPAARGFSLEVDDLKVVDLGTEFGLSVSDEGASVQVFDGEVELLQPETAKRLLTAGEALVRTPDGIYEDSTVTPDSFLDIASLETRAQGQQDERYQRWRNWSGKLRRDARLIAYYAFDQSDGWNRRLTSSLEPANSELDGAIVGADRSIGRWPAKSSLEFKRPGDRVRVQIPGEYRSLTFSCWVKIDSLDRWFNSLFLTDGYNKGEPHWQILDTGQLYFSVRPREQGEDGPADFKALSPPFWKPSLSGRWLHLATVYDVDRTSITHYLNGDVLNSAIVPVEKMIDETRIGTASIGNWSVPTQPDSRFAIRNLNGSMDEFILFATALSDDEIREIYNHGKP